MPNLINRSGICSSPIGNIGSVVAVGVDGTVVKVIVAVGTGFSVGVEIDAGAQETRTIERMTVSNVFVFMSRLEVKRLTACVTRWWAGRDSAALTEPALSQV